MGTRLTIAGIVLVAAAAAAAVVVLLVALLGVTAGVVAAVAAAAAVLGAYRRWVQPWQHRWGATDEEVGAVLPGDEIIPDAAGSTTRAITIDAAPTDVWPWLVQLGYDRAGWYSYDWIDNDGRPSADRVAPELQDLAVGDQILMGPGMGPAVRELAPNRYLVAGDREGGSWCLALRPGDGGTRLVSRWRVHWPLTPATVFWVLVSDPGAFIMERRMLKGIKERVEGTAVRPAA